jgi:RNA polymerase sigma-70 factor (ECF subfamily)
MTASSTQSEATAVASDDMELVHACKGGDVGAFEQLVKRYDRKLMRIAQSITHNREDSWLIRITVNQSLMKLRKQRVKKEVSLDEDFPSTEGVLPIDVIDWTPNPEQLYWASELQAILTSALEGVRPILQRVFVLRDIEGLTVEQTAEVLNLSHAAVKARLWRVRMQLRERLNKFFSMRAESAQAELLAAGSSASPLLAIVAECANYSRPYTHSISVARLPHTSITAPVASPA